MNRFFPEVPTNIPYEGTASRDPLVFRYFNPEQVVNGKTMEEHLRFSVAYWHTFKGSGQDPFGGASFDRPWNRFSSDMDIANGENWLTGEIDSAGTSGITHAVAILEMRYKENRAATVL